MASIVGALIDKRGNTQPDVLLIARIASNPAGDTGSTHTDQNGNYEITVTESGTKYYLYINSESGGVNGPNYSGTIISSGDVVSAFTLAADPTWKEEHYGDNDPAKTGEHEDINVDSVYFRSGGTIDGAGDIIVSKQFVHDKDFGYPSIDSYLVPPGNLYFATKQYVDAQVGAITTAGNFLDLDGTTVNFGVEHGDDIASDSEASDMIAMYDDDQGITVQISREDFLMGFMADLKSGTDQADSGAVAGEFYVDTNDDNTVKRGV